MYEVCAQGEPAGREDRQTDRIGKGKGKNQKSCEKLQHKKNVVVIIISKKNIYFVKKRCNDIPCFTTSTKGLPAICLSSTNTRK